MIETTDFSKSEQYTLSIRLSTDGFSFSIFNPLGEGRFSFHEHGVDDSLSLTANLKQAFRETDWLKNPFRRINVLMAGKRFTFIPLEFFEDEQAETVFYHNHSRQDNELVQYNILHKNNIVVLFGMDKSACSLLREQYPDVRFYAQASPLIEYFAAKSRLAIAGKCMCTCAKKQQRYTPTNAAGWHSPTPLPARRQTTASITFSVYGSSSAWRRNATSSTSPANCTTKSNCCPN